MGVYISTPFLARLCSMQKTVLGTVSCVAAEHVMTRILQAGDPEGHFRRALAQFPFPEISENILKKYFVKDGIPKGKKFKPAGALNLRPSPDLIKLMIVASFAFVWLAKEGHSEPISVNYLEKIQIPHIYHLTGAMLGGVDYVTMGAGITLQIPSVLDAISSGGNPSYRVQVEGSKDGFATISFNPSEFFGRKLPEMKRPGFLPIISTDVLGKLMTKRLPSGSIQGFVLELPTAGGHNAPPRDKGIFDEKGQPVYGPRDEVAFDKLQDLGIPFWIGGSFASPEGLAKAQSLGAVGIQAGSIFALSENSGMESNFRSEIRRQGWNKELVIRTDPNASPTGFPFKLIQLAGTQSDKVIYEARKRVCNICLLRTLHVHKDKIEYRCSSEPIFNYLSKGGKVEDTVGARCLCNVLLSAAGFGNPEEPPAFTLGDDVSFLRHLMKDSNDSYTAEQAVSYLLGQKT